MLGEDGLVAVDAVRLLLVHDVPVTPQLGVTLHTAEMVQVPPVRLRLRALIREDDLNINYW